MVLRRVARLPLLLLAAGLAACAAAPVAPEFDDPTDGAASFSRAVVTRELVFLAGVIGFDDGRLVPGGIVPETAQAIRNIESALAAHGLTLADVVKCTVFLADIGDFDAMNGVYRAAFAPPRPARTTIGGADIVADGKIEIECIAAR